jgi:hypothetical protein
MARQLSARTLRQIRRARHALNYIEDAARAGKDVSHLEEKRAFSLRVLEQYHACRRCGRLLEDPVSVARGFGDECASKMQEAS